MDLGLLLKQPGGLPENSRGLSETQWSDTPVCRIKTNMTLERSKKLSSRGNTKVCNSALRRTRWLSSFARWTLNFAH